MIGRYALPSDDQCFRLTPTVTASDADSAYPAENLVVENPAKPAKLTQPSGSFVLAFPEPVTVAAAALLYHNLDHELDVRLQWNSSDSWGSPAGEQAFTMPAIREDNWHVSPWIELASPVTYQFFRLLIAGTGPDNSLDVAVGRLMLVSALRDLENDVRWGVEEVEEHGLIELPTELGVETIYPLGGKRRRFNGELALQDSTAATFVALARSALGRTTSWLLIPDADVNDAWIVRFDEPRWARVRETINHNIFPFRVQELSRGLPWP